MAQGFAAGFDRRLAEVLAALPGTQAELADRADLRENTLSDWLGGKIERPQLRKVRQLADVTPDPGATLHYLRHGGTRPDWLGKLALRGTVRASGAVVRGAALADRGSIPAADVNLALLEAIASLARYQLTGEPVPLRDALGMIEAIGERLGLRPAAGTIPEAGAAGG